MRFQDINPNGINESPLKLVGKSALIKMVAELVLEHLKRNPTDDELKNLLSAIGKDLNIQDNTAVIDNK